MCTAAGFVTSTNSEVAPEWEHFHTTRCSSTKRSGSDIHVFELAFQQTEEILNTDFKCFDICTDVHFDSHMSAVAYSGHRFWVTSLNRL